MARNKQPEKVMLRVSAIKRETDNAVLVMIGLRDYWLPLSQVHSIHRAKLPYLYVTPWIMREKGLLAHEAYDEDPPEADTYDRFNGDL